MDVTSFDLELIDSPLLTENVAATRTPCRVSVPAVYNKGDGDNADAGGRNQTLRISLFREPTGASVPRQRLPVLGSVKRM